MTSTENLAVHTFQRYLEFLRHVLTQQDSNGRNPLHYANYEKSVKDTLDIGLEIETNLEDFKFECQQLQYVEASNAKPLDPKRYFDALKDLKHFLRADDENSYETIYNDFLREKKLLLQEILNQKDVCEETPLHIASRRGNYLLVKHYLKLGAKINKNINGKTPLDLAKDKFTRHALTNLNKEAYVCADDNVIQLIEKGDYVDQRYTIFGVPPLHKAVSSQKAENVETIKTILEYDANINLIDYNGWTALHHAAFKGDYEACVELIRNDANVNAYSTLIKTPIHLAANYNHPEIIHLLATNGANLEGISNDEFLQYSTNKNSILAENVAPLLLAAKKGNIE